MSGMRDDEVEDLPRRRVPLLAGERAGLVVGSPSIAMLSATTGIETALWLDNVTVELQRIAELSGEERLVEVAADLSYARTNTGRLVAL